MTIVAFDVLATACCLYHDCKT